MKTLIIEALDDAFILLEKRVPQTRIEIKYTRCYQLLKIRIMDLQELLEMNIEIATHFVAPQVQLPPIMKGMMQRLIELNEAKLKELT